jgi:choline dehydrogenase-like flavoprotein
VASPDPARSDPVDVVIVGAGVAGAVVAKRLVEAGLSVVCLEQGGWPDRADYPGATPEWELVAAKQWSSIPHLRNDPADYPVDLDDSDFGVLNFNGVGGGSVLYSAQWPRMLPDDFRVRSVDGVADDWPLGYADLQPHYEATDRDFGVSGLGGNPRSPAGEDPPLPPLPACASRAPTRGSVGTGGRAPTRSCRRRTTVGTRACSAGRAGRDATRARRRRPT